jgi:hypothetical protein
MGTTITTSYPSSNPRPYPHPASRAGISTSTPLLDGDAGVEQTIELIRAVVANGLKDPFVRQTAGQITANVRSFDELGEVKAIYNWVRSHVRFRKDPVHHESVASARWTLTHLFGDCDDINAVLLPSLLGVLGYECRLITVAGHPEAPQTFTHIYCEVDLGGRWLPLDAARPGASFGEAPKNYFRKRIWNLTDNGYQDLGGLGDIDWSGISDVINQAATDATKIIAAIRTGTAPGATTQPVQVQMPATSFSINPNYLLGGGALLALAMLRK